MQWLGTLRRRLAVLWRRERFDRDLEEEMQSHLQNAAEENAENGMSTEEARHAAQRQFGNQLLLREAAREIWCWRWLEALAQDLAHGLRMFRRNPGFTATVVLTLALGIGATTAIFTVVNGVLFRPLPYPEPDRLVYISNQVQGRPVSSLAYTRDYAQWTRYSRTLSVLAGYADYRANSAGQTEAERVTCGLATSTLFPLLGVQPVLGRGFLPQEDRPGGRPVALLEHAFWQRRFDGDTGAVGKTIMLDDKAYTIIGVLPRSFRIPDRYSGNFRRDLWVPFAISDTGQARDIILKVIGRLRPGANILAARDELTGLMRVQLRRNLKYSAVVQPWHEQISGGARRSLLLFLGAVGFVLLIVCVNVANLLLSRGAARGKEIAVRRAMGAARGRILRQLLTESVLIGLLGGVLGLVLAYVCKDLLLVLIAPKLPALDPIGLDRRVLFFNLGLALATGVAFGLAPAWQASKVELNETLKDTSRSATGGRSSSRARNVLAISEVALAMVLLCGAGLLFKSFVRLRGIDIGFQPDRILAFDISLTASRYPKPLDQARFLEQALVQIKGVPGVQSVAGGSCLPMSGRTMSYNDIAIEGHPGAPFDVHGVVVSADYFETMRIPLIAGRHFSNADREGAPGVVIVNQSFVRRYLPHENPLGMRITDPNRKNGWLTVVGVVGDVRPSPEEDAPPEIYCSYLQPGDPRIVWAGGGPSINIVMRTAGDPMSLVSATRTRIASIDSTQPPYGFATLDELRMQSISPRRVSMLLISAFAALALALGGIGIYGVLAYSVGQRTHEIGVRMALGAPRCQILGMVLWRGMGLIAAGVVIGIVASVGLTRMIASELWGVSATDPWTFVTVIVILAATGLAACWIPARRATTVDPLSALRYE